MTHKVGSNVLGIPLLAAALLLVACGQKAPTAAATTVNDANLTSKIQQARTPEDHQDIARYYDLQVQAAERKAAGDRELKRGYERKWPPGEPPAGPGAEGHLDSSTGTASLSIHGFGPSAEHHYDHLIERTEDEAREYHALAEEHRDMAARVDGSPPPQRE